MDPAWYRTAPRRGAAARWRVVVRELAAHPVLHASVLAIVVAACSDGAIAQSHERVTERTAATVPERIVIEVTGDDYRWHLRYPGRDGILGSDDDRIATRDIRVPTHTPTILHLRSRDYVYKLRLPHLSVAEIAVPGQEFSLAFDSGTAGELELRGDQFCGFSHPDLIGTLHVVPPSAFLEWVEGLEQSIARGGEEGER